eukprot:scpid57993/ scgid34429/ 
MLVIMALVLFLVVMMLVMVVVSVLLVLLVEGEGVVVSAGGAFATNVNGFYASESGSNTQQENDRDHLTQCRICMWVAHSPVLRVLKTNFYMYMYIVNAEGCSRSAQTKLVFHGSAIEMMAGENMGRN